MASNPLHEVSSERFRALFMLGADDDPDSVVNVDAEVTLHDGTRWSATFMTIAEIQRVMDRWRATGENGGGSYFHSSDLIIVREAGIGAMVGALEVALSEVGPHGVLTPIDESGP